MNDLDHAALDADFAARLTAVGNLTSVALVEGLVVRPGDTLIIRVGRTPTREDAHAIRKAVMERLPGLVDVVVMTANGFAVVRPEPDEAAR